MTDTGTPRQYDDERTDEERGAWHTPSIPQLDEDTLLYVRESIAGVIHATPKTGHHLERAIDLIDEIIRLRREHPLLSPAEHAVLLATLEAARSRPDPAGLDVRPEVLAWFHESEEICEHELSPWPCEIMADALLRAFDVSPRLAEHRDGTFGFEAHHFHRLDLAARLSVADGPGPEERPALPVEETGRS